MNEDSTPMDELLEVAAELAEYKRVLYRIADLAANEQRWQAARNV